MTETILSQPAFSSRPSTTSSLQNLIFKLGRNRNRDSKPVEYDHIETSQVNQAPSRVQSICSSSSERSSNCNAGANSATKNLRCDVLVESGLTNLIGTPSESAGAMLSGQVRLVLDETMGQCQLQRLKMILRLTTKFSKSGSKGCKKCAEVHQDLQTWNLISESRDFSSGTHSFPWSFLLPGDSPATASSALGSVEYDFIVSLDTPTTETKEFVQPLTVYRIVAQSRPATVNTLFPSSGLRTVLELPRVVSRSEKFNVSLSVRGVIQEGKQTRTIWRLQQLYWHVVEQTTAKTVTCEQHRRKSGGDKIKEQSKSKVLGNGIVSQGWNFNLKNPGGEITLDFEAFVTDPSNKSTTSSDVRSPSGLVVKHQLILEFTFSESLITNPNSKKGGMAYGSGRLIRMSYDLPVFDKACDDEVGWDQELPPSYVSDAATPPRYDVVS